MIAGLIEGTAFVADGGNGRHGEQGASGSNGRNGDCAGFGGWDAAQAGRPGEPGTNGGDGGASGSVILQTAGPAPAVSAYNSSRRLETPKLNQVGLLIDIYA